MSWLSRVRARWYWWRRGHQYQRLFRATRVVQVEDLPFVETEQLPDGRVRLHRPGDQWAYEFDPGTWHREGQR